MVKSQLNVLVPGMCCYVLVNLRLKCTISTKEHRKHSRVTASIFRIDDPKTILRKVQGQCGGLINYTCIEENHKKDHMLIDFSSLDRSDISYLKVT